MFFLTCTGLGYAPDYLQRLSFVHVIFEALDEQNLNNWAQLFKAALAKQTC